MAERQAATVDDWKDVPADDWKDVTPTASAPSPGIAPHAPSSLDVAMRAGGAALESLNPVPLIKAIASPRDTARGMFNATSDAVGRARDAFGKGEYGEAAKSATGAIPIIGPAAEQVVREGTGGKIPEAVGHAAGLIAAPKVYSSVGRGLVNAAPAAARFSRAALSAGGADVAAGGAKLAVGAGLDYAGVPYHAGTILGVHQGAPQIGRGLAKGFRAGREALTPPAPEPVFGDPEGFAKLPPNVQDAIRRGMPKISTPRSKPQALPPRDPSYYGIEPKLQEQVARPEINTMLTGLRQQSGLSEGQHLGEVPGAHYPERWAGSDSPTIRSTMAKTKFVKVNPEELGVHGGVEGTPIKGPLNTPEKIRIARELADAMKKGGK